jgi:hypothetical protein
VSEPDERSELEEATREYVDRLKKAYPGINEKIYTPWCSRLRVRGWMRPEGRGEGLAPGTQRKPGS